MIHTSEWVSLGHPDKMADYISSYILDRYLEQDPQTRYAVEVQIKDEFVSLAGEVTSKAHFTDDELSDFVRKAIEEIGYIPVYSKRWGLENAIFTPNLEVAVHIGQQSPDIAHGVDCSGWGDQGIFWGMACNETKSAMPKDHVLAKEIGLAIQNHVFDRSLGLDIKTQVELDGGKPRQVIVAVPMMYKHSEQYIRDMIRSQFKEIIGAQLTVNGTGIYKVHGPRGDAGTTGRKLAVDFYGGNCRIGGGSPWTKDGTKADLTLNLYARELSLQKMRLSGLPTVYTAINCCIGKRDIRITHFDKRMRQLQTYTESISPEILIQRFGLRMPKFAERCKAGLFYDIV